MRVLLTGASSFTGFWFAQTLARRGFQVVAPLRGSIGEYVGIRASRVSQLSNLVSLVERAPFGSEPFMELIRQHKFDALCHHAAEVANYRSLDFDVSAALSQNTRNLRRILEVMATRGLKAAIFTGTVFEQDEGIGENPIRAFSPYGLSKGLTWQVFQYWCATLAIPLGKFVIPNPFGPFEEPRFCAYLIERWRAGQIAEVRTPLYLRDNIHVDLLALAYAGFVMQVAQGGRDARMGVSGYRESQGAFAERMASQIRRRVGLDCRLALTQQVDFSEPMVRLNSETPDHAALDWEEARAWDAVAAYYFGNGADGGAAVSAATAPRGQ